MGAGLGGAFATRIEGNLHNVVGFSLALLCSLRAELDHSWIDLYISGLIRASAR